MSLYACFIWEASLLNQVFAVESLPVQNIGNKAFNPRTER